jgi:hypothetical protein
VQEGFSCGLGATGTGAPAAGGSTGFGRTIGAGEVTDNVEVEVEVTDADVAGSVVEVEVTDADVAGSVVEVPEVTVAVSEVWVSVGPVDAELESVGPVDEEEAAACVITSDVEPEP